MSGSCLKKCSPSDSSQQCTNNQTCIAVQGTGGVCYDQNTTIRQEGETCSSFTGNCQSGLVCTYMDVNNRDGFCMNSCDPNTPTCPGGECLKLSNGKGACYKKPANTRQVDEICDPIKGYCASDMICVNLDNNKSGGICSAVCSPDPAGSVSQCGTGKKCFTLSDGRGACLNEPALTKAKGEVCSFNQGYCQGDMLCVNIYASSTEGICLEKCDLQSPQCGTEEQCLELQGGGGACY